MFSLYLVSVIYFESDGDLLLAKADRTEVLRAAVRLLQVVGARLHHTAQPLARLQPKHVANLMGHYLQKKYPTLEKNNQHH